MAIGSKTDFRWQYCQEEYRFKDGKNVHRYGFKNFCISDKQATHLCSDWIRSRAKDTKHTQCNHSLLVYTVKSAVFAYMMNQQIECLSSDAKI